MTKKFIFVALLAAAGIFTFKVSAQRVHADNRITSSFRFALPKGLPTRLWYKAIPKDNPLSDAKIHLGKALYFDKRLSRDGTVSCATCHDPANAFTDNIPVAIGESGRAGTRNAPTILNSAFSLRQFWDGRASSLEEQAKQPLVNSFEMGMSNHDAVVARVSSSSEYQAAFRLVFKREGITIDTIVKAIAAFERTQLSGNSPFDQFLAGDKGAITPAQQRGWKLFKGKARCIECHSFRSESPFFTDFKFHNTGVATKGKRSDQFASLALDIKSVEGRSEPGVLAHSEKFSQLGRYLVTRQPQDLAAFKTPTLRDIELTTPYMHDGSEKTLLDVVRFYNNGGEPNPNLDKRLRPLRLTDQEIGELVEFMRALTSDDVLRQAQQIRPQTRSAASLPPNQPEP